MTKKGAQTATYKRVETEQGNRYQFFCDCSGAMMVETKEVKEAELENEVLTAWKTEGKEHFNLCHACGAWVSDVMYNPDVLKCVLCAPLEETTEYCPFCGVKTRKDAIFCHQCGKRLLYGGGTK